MIIHPTFLQLTPGWLVALFVFIFIIVFYHIGHAFQLRRKKNKPEFGINDSGKIAGALIGLLGFLLAFTFSMSNSRFDHRRQLVVEEANDIATAFLRTKAYPDSLRQLLTPAFNAYLEERIAYSVGLLKTNDDLGILKAHWEKADSIGKSIWDIAVSLTKTTPYLVTSSQLLPELNAMIDITTLRLAAGEETVPDSIMFFLFVLAFAAAFVMGYENKGDVDWIILTAFSLMISFTIFTIIDLDRPRAGFIRMEGPIQKILDLRGTLK